ncbi:MAG: hypothetical protein UH734_09400 [Ruminococcus sp.]|nr:hypothetical protein [Ruminococcus sp.]
MAIQFISVKCPKCGAELSVENGREFAYCSYCGTKVIISNDNEHIFRTIDEASVKQAETDRIVKLKKLEIEAKSKRGRIALIIGWVVIFFIVAIVSFVTEGSFMGMFSWIWILVGLFLGFYLLDNNGN